MAYEQQVSDTRADYLHYGKAGEGQLLQPSLEGKEGANLSLWIERSLSC